MKKGRKRGREGGREGEGRKEGGKEGRKATLLLGEKLVIEVGRRATFKETKAKGGETDARPQTFMLKM